MAKNENTTILRSWVFEKGQDCSLGSIKKSLDESNEAFGLPMYVYYNNEDNPSVVMVSNKEHSDYMKMQFYNGLENGNPTVEMLVRGKGNQVRAEDLADSFSKLVGSISSFRSSVKMGRQRFGSGGGLGAGIGHAMAGGGKLLAKGFRALTRDKEAYENELAFYNYGMSFGDFTFGGRTTKEQLTTLEEQAESGNTKAKYLFASTYELGHGVDPDHELAMKWFESAAEDGNRESQEAVISEFLFNEEKEYDVEKKHKAIGYLRGIASGGNEDAMGTLLAIYRMGTIKDIPKDIDEEIRLAEEFASKGHMDSKYTLFVAYDSTCGGEEYSKFNDDKKAAEIYQSMLADGAGDLTGTVARNLAYMYQDGRGVEKSQDKAVEYYNMAAEAGNIDAKVLLTIMRTLGEGMEKDHVEANRTCDELLKSEDASVVSIANYCKYKIADEAKKYRDSMKYAKQYLEGEFKEDDKAQEVQKYLDDIEAKLATMSEDEQYEFFGEKKPFSLGGLFKRKK